jgi:hypothetical protein
MALKSYIFWEIMPYNPLKVKRRFGGTRPFHLQDGKKSQSRNHQTALLHNWAMLVS